MSGGPEDKVGYGRPPKHSQFRTGQSGNPAGRPKATPDLVSTLRKALARKVTVAGQERKVTLQEALFRRLRELAQQGDRRAQKLQQEIAQAHEAQVKRDRGAEAIDWIAKRRRLAEKLGRPLPEPDDGESAGKPGGRAGPWRLSASRGRAPAARARSPRRRPPGSRGQSGNPRGRPKGRADVLADPLAPAELSDAVLAAQALQHDADLLLGREPAPGGAPDVLQGGLGRGLRPWPGCLSHLRSLRLR